jgi:transketolase
LGSRVAGLLMQASVTPPLRIVGIPDEYTWTGSQQEIFEHYGITPAGLSTTAEALLERQLIAAD